MQTDGRGWLYVPSGLTDGPMPTHYEPHESPFRNALYAQQANPARIVYEREDNPSNPSPPEKHGDVFPFVFTTSRLTEHHTAGGMSRQLPYLSELQPGLFVEVSRELASIRGLKHMPHGAPGTSTSAAASSPVAQRVKKLTPTARTSGSAKRSSIKAALVARARPAATIVAVAPTLVARSQVSFSVR